MSNESPDWADSWRRLKVNKRIDYEMMTWYYGVQSRGMYVVHAPGLIPLVHDSRYLPGWQARNTGHEEEQGPCQQHVRGSSCGDSSNHGDNNRNNSREDDNNSTSNRDIPRKHEQVNQVFVGPASQTVGQHWNSINTCNSKNNAKAQQHEAFYGALNIVRRWASIEQTWAQ